MVGADEVDAVSRRGLGQMLMTVLPPGINDPQPLRLIGPAAAVVCLRQGNEAVGFVQVAGGLVRAPLAAAGRYPRRTASARH